ncbi:MAG: putative Ig domain-containing protein, partial [Candidatus Gracilibacteria bacterium]|nr:putative Ig domain-containing protein [Candidatus Gracilibacteria bacterium]
GSLPPGLALNTSTGAITGTPTTAGTYNITVTATDNDGASNADAIQFTVNAAPDTTPPSTPATLTLTGNAGASAGYTNTQSISLNVADVADPSGVSWFVVETANGVAATAPAAGDGGWSSTKPTSFSLSAGNAAKDITVFVKDNAAPTNNVQSTGKISTITLDGVTPSAPAWTTGVVLKSTAYTNRQVTLNVGTSGISATGLSVTAGGTISNVSVSGGVVTFNYTTPNAAGDTITISGTSGAGTAFSTTIDTPALSDPADTTLPNTPSLNINTGNAYTNSTNVSISITGDTDNVGVTGWYVSESSSTPALGDFIAEPTTATISAGDGVKTLYAWTRDAAGNISLSGNDTITLDGVTPNTPAWTAGVTTRATAYTNRQVTLNVGTSGISATGLSVTAGGTISNVSVSGGVVTFDYTTPNAAGDTITISGNSGAGTAFSTTIDTPALN